MRHGQHLLLSCMDICFESGDGLAKRVKVYVLLRRVARMTLADAPMSIANSTEYFQGALLAPDVIPK